MVHGEPGIQLRPDLHPGATAKIVPNGRWRREFPRHRRCGRGRCRKTRHEAIKDHLDFDIGGPLLELVGEFYSHVITIENADVNVNCVLRLGYPALQQREKLVAVNQVKDGRARVIMLARSGRDVWKTKMAGGKKSPPPRPKRKTA